MSIHILNQSCLPAPLHPDSGFVSMRKIFTTPVSHARGDENTVPSYDKPFTRPPIGVRIPPKPDRLAARPLPTARPEKNESQVLFGTPIDFNVINNDSLRYPTEQLFSNFKN